MDKENEKKIYMKQVIQELLGTIVFINNNLLYFANIGYSNRCLIGKKMNLLQQKKNAQMVKKK